MCLKTAPLTKPSASELPFPSVAPTLCQDAGRSYSLSAYPGQYHCEQCLQQKGKKKRRWPNLSFHFHQMLGSAPANKTTTQPSHSMNTQKKTGPNPLNSLIQWTLSVSFSPTENSSHWLFSLLTQPVTPSTLHLLISSLLQWWSLPFCKVQKYPNIYITTLLLVCLTLNNEKRLTPILMIPGFHLPLPVKGDEEDLLSPCLSSLKLSQLELEQHGLWFLEQVSVPSWLLTFNSGGKRIIKLFFSSSYKHFMSQIVKY